MSPADIANGNEKKGTRMRRFTTREGIPIAYEDDYFGPPWLAAEAETVVLLHGTSESSQVWYAWVPPLTARYRVLRPDLPGFGQSRIGADVPYDWSAQRIAGDLLQWLDHLGVASAHFVGAKYGGSISTTIALQAPQRVRSLTAITGPMGIDKKPAEVEVGKFASRIESSHADWVNETMVARLGTASSPALREWLTTLMTPSDARAASGCATGTVNLQLFKHLDDIAAPTLIVTTDRNRMVPRQTYADWANAIPGAKLVVLPGDGYHPAVSDPQPCVEAVMAHIDGATRRTT
ncbi:alpha/beta fold hydrolase [Ramlibacter sp.]|uniref:alpha/beta fold hydrolase n=1 Tax=Ramlibacter sp. TaxID=1917967 RepID=UPI003D111F80